MTTEQDMLDALIQHQVYSYRASTKAVNDLNAGFLTASNSFVSKLRDLLDDLTDAEKEALTIGKYTTDNLKEIKTLFEKSTLLTIQTRATTYENMIISDIPHDESAEVFDGIIIAMKLIEVNIVKPEITYAPRASSNASTVSRGKQNNTEQPTGERRQSLLSKAFS